MTRPAINQQITFLYSQQYEKSTEFYEEILGLPLVVDQGGCRIYQTAEAAYIGVCQRPQQAGRTAGVILTLVVEDVDGWYAYLSERGVPFDKPPVLNQAYKIYHLFARDPDGYVIEIQRFLDENWHKV